MLVELSLVQLGNLSRCVRAFILSNLQRTFIAELYCRTPPLWASLKAKRQGVAALSLIHI